MANPFPGMTIKVRSENQLLTYLNTSNKLKTTKNNVKSISNYDYEVEKNDEKRNILILKPEFLSVFLEDMKNIMTYDKSSQFIDEKTKQGYNPNITGI